VVRGAHGALSALTVLLHALLEAAKTRSLRAKAATASTQTEAAVEAAARRTTGFAVGRAGTPMRSRRREISLRAEVATASTQTQTEAAVEAAARGTTGFAVRRTGGRQCRHAEQDGQPVGREEGRSQQEAEGDKPEEQGQLVE
jgi:hypothetical protein